MAYKAVTVENSKQQKMRANTLVLPEKANKNVGASTIHASSVRSYWETQWPASLTVS